MLIFFLIFQYVVKNKLTSKTDVLYNNHKDDFYYHFLTR